MSMSAIPPGISTLTNQLLLPCSPTSPINFLANPIHRIDFCKWLLGNQHSRHPSMMNTLSLPLLCFLKYICIEKHSQSLLGNRLLLATLENLCLWFSRIGVQKKGRLQQRNPVFIFSLFLDHSMISIPPTLVCIFPYAICIHAPFCAMFKRTKQKQKSSTVVQLPRLHVISSYFKGGSSCSIVALNKHVSLQTSQTQGR